LDSGQPLFFFCFADLDGYAMPSIRFFLSPLPHLFLRFAHGAAELLLALLIRFDAESTHSHPLGLSTDGFLGLTGG
jgi:hypothetical protein